MKHKRKQKMINLALIIVTILLLSNTVTTFVFAYISKINDFKGCDFFTIRKFSYYVTESARTYYTGIIGIILVICLFMLLICKLIGGNLIIGKMKKD